MEEEELEKLYKENYHNRYGQRFDANEDPEDEDLSDLEWWEKERKN